MIKNKVTPGSVIQAKYNIVPPIELDAAFPIHTLVTNFIKTRKVPYELLAPFIENNIDHLGDVGRLVRLMSTYNNADNFSPHFSSLLSKTLSRTTATPVYYAFLDKAKDLKLDPILMSWARKVDSMTDSQLVHISLIYEHALQSFNTTIQTICLWLYAEILFQKCLFFPSMSYLLTSLSSLLSSPSPSSSLLFVIASRILEVLPFLHVSFPFLLDHYNPSPLVQLLINNANSSDATAHSIAEANLIKNKKSNKVDGIDLDTDLTAMACLHSPLRVLTVIGSHVINSFSRDPSHLQSYLGACIISAVNSYAASYSNTASPLYMHKSKSGFTAALLMMLHSMPSSRMLAGVSPISIEVSIRTLFQSLNTHLSDSILSIYSQNLESTPTPPTPSISGNKFSFIHLQDIALQSFSGAASNKLRSVSPNLFTQSNSAASHTSLNLSDIDYPVQLLPNSASFTELHILEYYLTTTLTPHDVLCAISQNKVDFEGAVEPNPFSYNSKNEAKSKLLREIGHLWVKISKNHKILSEKELFHLMELYVRPSKKLDLHSRHTSYKNSTQSKLKDQKFERRSVNSTQSNEFFSGQAYIQHFRNMIPESDKPNNSSTRSPAFKFIDNPWTARTQFPSHLSAYIDSPNLSTLWTSLLHGLSFLSSTPLLSPELSSQLLFDVIWSIIEERYIYSGIKVDQLVLDTQTSRTFILDLISHGALTTGRVLLDQDSVLVINDSPVSKVNTLRASLTAGQLTLMNAFFKQMLIYRKTVLNITNQHHSVIHNLPSEISTSLQSPNA